MWRAQASRLVVGNAVEEATVVGPLIRPREVQRVDEWVAEAAQAGCTVLCGGEPAGKTADRPTILLNPPAEVRLSTQEIFGPVIAVYAYDALDDAVSMANALPFAFQAAAFTQRLDVARKLIMALDATAVMINDHTAFRVDWMPFAARRQSGFGTGGIGHTMHDMTQNEMAVIKLS